MLLAILKSTQHYTVVCLLKWRDPAVFGQWRILFWRALKTTEASDIIQVKTQQMKSLPYEENGASGTNSCIHEFASKNRW